MTQLSLPVSHWAWSQTRGEEPRCTGTIRELDDTRTENFVLAACDTCIFEVGIALPHGRRLTSPPITGPVDPDVRTQSQPVEGAAF